jgi:hypothetical protein
MNDEERRQGLMEPQEFERLFREILTNERFRLELAQNGFDALNRRGINVGVRMDNDIMERINRRVGIGLAYKECGACGVCGACGLCGGADFGSASAALWATFALALHSETV